MVTLGAFIVWLGFLAFNAGSHSSLGGISDAVAVSNIIVNSNLAGAAGTIAAICLSRWVLGGTDLLAPLNGGIAGLVAIAAGPDIGAGHWAVAIGGVGGVLCLLGMKLLERLKIDDEVGAIPAHLGAGVWGTLAVSIEAGGDPVIQCIGIAVIGATAFGASLIAWWSIDRLWGCRVSVSVERTGQDVALGIRTFPEFAQPVEDV